MSGNLFYLAYLSQGYIYENLLGTSICDYSLLPIQVVRQLSPGKETVLQILTKPQFGELTNFFCFLLMQASL